MKPDGGQPASSRSVRVFTEQHTPTRVKSDWLLYFRSSGPCSIANSPGSEYAACPRRFSLLQSRSNWSRIMTQHVFPWSCFYSCRTRDKTKTTPVCRSPSPSTRKGCAPATMKRWPRVCPASLLHLQAVTAKDQLFRTHANQHNRNGFPSKAPTPHQSVQMSIQHPFGRCRVLNDTARPPSTTLTLSLRL